jgi:hypothetical protein
MSDHLLTHIRNYSTGFNEILYWESEPKDVGRSVLLSPPAQYITLYKKQKSYFNNFLIKGLLKKKNGT